MTSYNNSFVRPYWLAFPYPATFEKLAAHSVEHQMDFLLIASAIVKSLRYFGLAGRVGQQPQLPGDNRAPDCRVNVLSLMVSIASKEKVHDHCNEPKSYL